MEIVAAILGAIVAVLAGAWINSVFTWKIKNRVKALDNTYLDVLKVNESFLYYCLKHHQDPENINGIRDVLINTMKPMIRMAYLNCFIIDEIKCGKLYKKMYLWQQVISDNANDMYFDNLKQKWIKPSPESFVVINGAKPDEIAENYQILLNDVTEVIFSYRKEITSFSYMVKQLCPIKCYKVEPL